MTRGTFYLIHNYKTDSILFSSCEFNGDMYPGGHYEEAVSLLSHVRSAADFYKIAFVFDKRNFHYAEQENSSFFSFDRKVMIANTIPKLSHISFNKNTVIDMRINYFENWFSDYLFFRIIGEAPVQFIDTDGKPYFAQPGETITFNFGQFVDLFNTENKSVMTSINKDTHKLQTSGTSGAANDTKIRVEVV